MARSRADTKLKLDGRSEDTGKRTLVKKRGEKLEGGSDKKNRKIS